MKKIKELYDDIMELTGEITKDHVGAYAAQTAFFFMLCMIPIILLLLTMVQYTPVTKADVMTAVIQVFPSSVDSLITSIVNQVYNQSSGIIPITIVVALWSAGKGVLAMSSGLNCVYNCRETRNYFFLMADWLIRARNIITPIVMIIFLLLIYKFLPNRRDMYRRQLPGAVFSTLGWMVISWVFSVYVDVFRGFSSMYGSLTTIMLIMMWMYFCMYCILIGGELNVMFGEKIDESEER